jgi:hypothetical protein
MNLQFPKELSQELLEADRLFYQSIMPWWPRIQTSIELIKLDKTWNAMPGVVYGLYRDLGFKKDFCIAMTNIFKINYLASFIHEIVKGEEEGQEYNRDMQFHILIGDFLFGKMLSLLIKADADILIPFFTEMICEISEGMVSFYKLGAIHNEYIDKTKASYYKTAFLTAAASAGKPCHEQDLYKQAGHKLGMAIELLLNEADNGTVKSLLEESERLLNSCHNSKYKNSILAMVYKQLRAEFNKAEELAAV